MSNTLMSQVESRTEYKRNGEKSANWREVDVNK